MDVQPQVAGVVATQQQQVHRFDQQEGERDQEGHERHKEQHLVARHTGETAQAPDHVGTNILLHAEELQHADDGVGHIADHHADDQQRDVAFDLGGDKYDQCQDGERAQDGGHREGDLAQIAQAAQRYASEGTREQNHESNAQTGSGAHTQHRWISQRIAEDGLHLETAHRECRPRHQSGQCLWYPRLPQDVLPHDRLLLTA